jgi:hypothetical protein
MGAFTWDTLAQMLGAGATLATGALAVFAAWWVGSRQSKIMAEQTAIALRQTEIEHQGLRAELFDRRMQVYEATVRWLQDIWANGNAPKGDLHANYIWAMEKAKFLFRPAVAEQMEEWFRMATKADLLDKLEKLEEAMPIRQQLWDLAKTVNNTFGDEMRLGGQA